MGERETLESKTCRYVAKFTAEKRSLDWLLARYERMYRRYHVLVHCGDGSRSSGALIEEAVAETNAAARLLAAKGIIRKEIR